MKIVSSAKSILKNISKGNIDKALKLLRIRSIFQFKFNRFNKLWKQIKNDDDKYERQYLVFQDLNKFVFDFNEEDLLFWLKKAGLGLIGIIAAIVVGGIIPFICPDKHELPDDCTIVVSTFDGIEPQRLYDALDHKNNFYSTEIVLSEYGIALDSIYFETEFLKGIDGKPQVILYGSYSREKHMKINIVKPPDEITKLLQSNALKDSFFLYDDRSDLLKKELHKSGAWIAIVSSFADISLCPNSFNVIKADLENKINKLEDETTKALLFAYHSENSFKNDDISGALRAINNSIAYNSSDYTNYARRGRIRDTLNDISGAFEDYSHFLDNIERSGNPVITNHVVRKQRRRMVSEEFSKKGNQIFDSRFTKSMYKKALNDDIKFLDSTRLKIIDKNKMIDEIKTTLLTIQHKSVFGRVVGNDSKPISNVHVQIVKSSSFVKTNGNGSYKINIEDSSKELKFSKSNYKTIILPLKNQTKLNVTLLKDLPRKTILAGKVVDKATALPIKGVKISVKGNSKNTYTDGSGDYKLEIADQRGTLVADFQGYERKSLDFEKSIKVDISLVKKPPTNIVKGKVSSDTGQPLIGANITIPSNNISTVTDINGDFTLQAKTPIRELIASFSGYYPDTMLLGNKNSFDFALKEMKHFELLTPPFNGSLISNTIIDVTTSDEKPITLICNNPEYKQSYELNAVMYRFNTVQEYRTYKSSLDRNIKEATVTGKLQLKNSSTVTPNKLYNFIRRKNIMVSERKFDFKKLLEDKYHYLILYVENERALTDDAKNVIKTSNLKGEIVIKL